MYQNTNLEERKLGVGHISTLGTTFVNFFPANIKLTSFFKNLKGQNHVYFHVKTGRRISFGGGFLSLCCHKL